MKVVSETVHIPDKNVLLQLHTRTERHVLFPAATPAVWIAHVRF